MTPSVTYGVQAYQIQVRCKSSYASEKAFKMLCSFEDPIHEDAFGGYSFLCGVVCASSGENAVGLVKRELELAGAEDLKVALITAEDEEKEEKDVPHSQRQPEGGQRIVWEEGPEGKFTPKAA
jgi:hypothetical protein